MTLYQIKRTDTGAVVGKAWGVWKARTLRSDLAWVLMTECEIVAVDI